MKYAKAYEIFDSQIFWRILFHLRRRRRFHPSLLGFHIAKQYFILITSMHLNTFLHPPRPSRAVRLGGARGTNNRGNLRSKCEGLAPRSPPSPPEKRLHFCEVFFQFYSLMRVLFSSKVILLRSDIRLKPSCLRIEYHFCHRQKYHILQKQNISLRHRRNITTFH